MPMREAPLPAEKRTRLSILLSAASDTAEPTAIPRSVTLNAQTKSKGKIVIEYYSQDEFEGILEKLGVEL